MFLITVKCDNPDRFEIPGVYFDFTIFIESDVEFYSLQAAGNSIQLSALSVGLSSLGYDNNGIIIYNNGSEFLAFDRTCPHDFPTSIAVNSEGAGSAKCPECGSIFMFPALGFPPSGSPSKYPLKEYKTIFSSVSGALRVFN